MTQRGGAHAQRCGIAGRGGVNQQEWVLRGSVSFSVTWRRGFAQRRGLPLPPRRHSYGGTLKHKSPTPAGAGRGSSAAGRGQQGDGMTVEELHDGRGEVLKHTSSALAGERTLLCTLWVCVGFRAIQGPLLTPTFVSLFSFWPEGETAVRQNGDPELSRRVLSAHSGLQHVLASGSGLTG